eukprot:4122563-Amphidinium_carterae.1
MLQQPSVIDAWVQISSNMRVVDEQLTNARRVLDTMFEPYLEQHRHAVVPQLREEWVALLRDVDIAQEFAQVPVLLEINAPVLVMWTVTGFISMGSKDAASRAQPHDHHW